MDDHHTLIEWSRAWFTTETAKGRAFDDIRAQFNAASPVLVSLYNAITTTDRDQTADLCDAITRAYARADD